MDFITKFPSKEWNSYLVVLANGAESVRDAIGFEYCLASSSGWTKGTYDSDFERYNEGIDWESSLTGIELVQETTNKVMLIKEKLQAARDCQKSYVETFRVEVGDKMMLEVSSWKDVVYFGKKEMLAPRYVGPFEIIKGIGPMAY
ncbi:hypothetical protein Tco_1387971 [Tanacetum coccineum]